jgi:competence ComEA-like helix-hairpin-helix protein
MSQWWQNVVKDYFTFSAKERKGIIVGASIVAVIVAVLHFYPAKKAVVKKDAFQQELTQLKISIDTSRAYHNYQRDDNDQDYYQPKSYDRSGNFQGELFAFDPNTLNDEGWRRLGVREKTIHTIQNFIAKGYKFRRPEDIARIYGLRPEDAQRLIPYVRIAGAEDNLVNSYAGHTTTSYAPKNDYAAKTRIIDINTADSSAFISLPGIGSKLAARIINFRQKLGGFATVNQIAETYGLPDSTFQLVKTRMECNAAAVKKININTAEMSDLRTHPYIKWNIANAIVNYRMQHGNYKTIEDIKKIEIITPDVFNRIAPYLII